ncbi:MAG: recombination mediator RecR [Anaerolineaceae bacterium]|nr:recombination mediator RecR [Anaerolineaceae bacterium]
MAILPAPLQDLINALERLPGIGPKTASRLAFFLLRAPDDLSQQLAEALQQLKQATGFCNICHNITLSSQQECEICANDQRDASLICVVEEPSDVLAIERTDGFQGRYHVLQGVISPIEGVGPDDLKVKSLIKRVADGGIKEVIIATNPSMEGDATALYLRRQLAPYGVRITRLARGLPVGGDLEYADQNTLLRALAGRQEL